MTDWREGILEHFQPGFARLTLVSDPDGLLTEEGMLTAIQRRGFDMIAFDDPIAFRFAYESQYRSVWDSGQATDLVVVLRSADRPLESLPYDLFKAGRRLAFALHQLFPRLNYPVIAELDRVYLDTIAAEYDPHGAPMTVRETREFVLMHCFRIVPGLVTTPVDLLKVLLSLHSRKIRLPHTLGDHLIALLSQKSALDPWPIARILHDRDEFLSFIQQQWELYLESLDDPGLRSLVPFDHEDVRAYTDTLFLDGSLTPVAYDNAALLPAWARTGVVHDVEADSLRRFEILLHRFQAALPEPDASHRDWQQAAQGWAELVVLRWELDSLLDDTDRQIWAELQTLVQALFAGWMLQRYGSLHNLPYHQQPVMVHQIPHYLAVERTRSKLAKIALLVLDGLALDQWLLLRKGMESGGHGWRFQESAVFAWVPTLTSVSRQAIFAAEPPLYFPDSLGTTSKEKAHWQRFWEDHGIPRGGTEFIGNLAGDADPRLDAVLASPRLTVLGIVWNKVDDIMHGMQMQTAGMHDQVRLWASQGHLQRLILRLQGEGFAVYLTSDHGNVTAAGVGNPQEGVLVETRGKRARVYDRPEFRDEAAAKFPGSIPWPGPGLPPGRHVLLAGDLTAFADKGDEIVGHGGIALEEVMVPFVRITKEGA